MGNDFRFNIDNLTVSVSPSRELLGRIGAQDSSAVIRSLLREKPTLNIIFASAPSQMDVLNSLMAEEDIDWSRINAFHMDEYIGLPFEAPQSFGNYLRVRFFSKLPFKNVFYIDGMTDDVGKECQRYSQLLQESPVDIAFLGIGENGHLAFNDPYIANFKDPLLVKENSKLDAVCRMQQVKDGWFGSEQDVPRSAISLTIPALMAAEYIFTIVPGKTKKEIVKLALEGPISETCPGSIIRTHKAAILYLDNDSASLLKISS